MRIEREGELVHRIVDFQENDVDIGGMRMQDFISLLPEVATDDYAPYEQVTRYGLCRVTIERLA